MTHYVSLAATTPFAAPLHLPAPHGSRAAIEQAVRNGVDFSFRVIDVDLTAAHLVGGIFTSACFTGSLKNARLDEARLDKSQLDGVDLSGATAHDATFQQASFMGANLAGIRADRADMGSANFRGANLSHSSFREARFNGAKMDRTITTGMDVAGATIHKAAVRPEQLADMGTPMEDIEFLAINGRTRAQAEAAMADAMALAAINHFKTT